MIPVDSLYPRGLQPRGWRKNLKKQLLAGETNSEGAFLFFEPENGKRSDNNNEGRVNSSPWPRKKKKKKKKRKIKTLSEIEKDEAYGTKIREKRGDRVPATMD